MKLVINTASMNIFPTSSLEVSGDVFQVVVIPAVVRHEEISR